MRNLSNYFLANLVKLKGRLKPEIEKALNGITSQGERVTALSKNKIELERARLDLKKQYKELGLYIFNQYNLKSTLDFSSDIHYVKKLNDLKNLNNLIKRIKEERKKIRKT